MQELRLSEHKSISFTKAELFGALGIDLEWDFIKAHADRFPEKNGEYSEQVVITLGKLTAPMADIVESVTTGNPFLVL